MFGKIKEEVDSFFERDPAARSRLEVYLCYPGFHAIISHRLTNWLWRKRFRTLARFIAYISRSITGIEIHPGATIGRNLFIDHGMGVVIGETATVGNNVTIYHGVTLGGVSPQSDEKGAKRHPQVGDNVIIGSGAQLLGAIEIGSGSRIGSNAVVVTDVEPGAVMVGIPARKVVRREMLVPKDGFKAYGAMSEEEVDSRQVTIETLVAEVSAMKARINELENNAEKSAEGWTASKKVN